MGFSVGFNSVNPKNISCPPRGRNGRPSYGCDPSISARFRFRFRFRFRKTPDMNQLPFDRLDVYKAALEFAAKSHRLCAGLKRGFGHVADQLRRSSCSVLTNTAEAATEFSPDEKARIFRLALRSTGESLALIALLVELDAATEE